MSHDPARVLLGATRSNIKDVSNHPGNIQAGVGVRLASSGSLSLTKADGELLGVSLGRSLDGLTARTAVCRAGLGVPVLAKSGNTLAVGDQVGIDDATGEASDVDTGVTGVNAVVVAIGLTGVKEDGTTAPCVLIDFPGGL